MKKPVLIIAVLLIPSILLKSVYEVDYYVEERAEMRAFSVDDYFTGTGFDFQQYGEQNEYIGKKDDCYIVVGLSDRDGNSDAIFEAAHRNEGSKLIYLYRRVISSKPPYFQAQFDHYAQMLKVAVGGKPEVNLILHIAAQSGCTDKSFSPLEFE